MDYTVTGFTLDPDTGVTEPFEVTVRDVEDKGTARWEVRRALDPGEPITEIEETPPGPEREAVEIRDPEEPREAPRSPDEAAEYHRLVSAVHITAVEEVS